MIKSEIIAWLLEGDIAIQYQTCRDLLGEEKSMLRNKISLEGWGKTLLDCRNSRGHWGSGFYQPKWTSSHYTLLDLRNLNIDPENSIIRQSIRSILNHEKGPDGGINPSGFIKQSDVCINGMFLNYAAYFKSEETDLNSVIDFILSQKMNDGGFNCHSNRKGAKHSSLHTTLSVLEGIFEYDSNGYTYRKDELRRAREESDEFILVHRLFRSDKTFNVINSKFMKFHFPCRWYYDVLRAMDYFQAAQAKYDSRMVDAIELILTQKTKQETWNLGAKYPGAEHFEMEKPGQPSRWNTLRAMRVLRHIKV